MIFDNIKGFLLATGNKSLLSLDISKNIFGVAYSDNLQKIAFPFTIIKRSNFNKDIEKIVQIYNSKDAGGIVVGLPLNNNGSKSPNTQRVLDTVKEILNYHNFAIYLQDERYSTVAVKNLTASKSKKNLDDLAATWILQSFLDKANN